MAYEKRLKHQRAFLQGLEEKSFGQLLAELLTKRDPVMEDARVAGCSIFRFELDDRYVRNVLNGTKEEYLKLAVFVVKRILQEAP